MTRGSGQTVSVRGYRPDDLSERRGPHEEGLGRRGRGQRGGRRSNVLRRGSVIGPPAAMLRLEIGYQGLSRGFLNGTLVPHVEQHGVG